MKNISCFLLGFLFLSCSHPVQEPQTSVPSITIDADNVETLKLSDFFSDISYVLLSDSFLIGDMDEAKIYDGKLFVLTNKSVLVFDTQSGGALLNVRHPGQGPGEYISLYDMLYDKNENTVELLDMNKQKVLKYGFDGHFISEFKTSFSSFSFHKINPSTYLFDNNNMMSDITRHRLIRYDARTSKITATRFPIDRHLATYFFVTGNSFGSTSNPSFHFSPSDTVYGFTDDYAPYAKYVLDFGKHHTPHRFYRENYTDIRDFSVKADRLSYIHTYGNFCENDSMAALHFLKDKKHCWVLYDKNTHATRTADRWIDDYHSGSSINIAYNNGPFIMDTEYLYFFLQPSQLISLMEKDKRLNVRENSHGNLNDICHSPDFSEQSNPILVKCKFKSL
jgi:hypothetical protein